MLVDIPKTGAPTLCMMMSLQKMIQKNESESLSDISRPLPVITYRFERSPMHVNDLLREISSARQSNSPAADVQVEF